MLLCQFAVLDVHIKTKVILICPEYRRTIFIPPKPFNRRDVHMNCPQMVVCNLRSRLFSCPRFTKLAQPCISSRQINWSCRSNVDRGQSDPPLSNSDTGTRLMKVISSFSGRLTTRINELKKGLAGKILFFLVGFYCSTAFSTVIGQTGDWDILSAGLAVVVVEAIGAVMYKTSLTVVGRFKSLITMFNYWKAGLSLGLFLDAFKYEFNTIVESCKPFHFDTDIHLCW